MYVSFGNLEGDIVNAASQSKSKSCMSVTSRGRPFVFQLFYCMFSHLVIEDIEREQG